MYRLTTSFPYVLNRVGVRMGELFTRRIAGYGISLPMYRVLAALWEESDRRLRDLSAITTVEISTLSRLVGDMERQGLVTRTRPAGNGRTVAISLTEMGRSLARELMPIAAHFEVAATAGFSPDQVARLKMELERVYGNLDVLESEISRVEAQPRSRTAS